MQKCQQQLALLALVAALALLGVVVVTVAVTIPLQQAEARGCESGGAGVAFNASKGRCFGHGP
ncbi:MAG: hypothetical protein M3264_02630 [Thermoproteota archaeon]|jgi:hypothetical protein|nr:hypothetical protein [Thermoproteota archaeon]